MAMKSVLQEYLSQGITSLSSSQMALAKKKGSCFFCGDDRVYHNAPFSKDLGMCTGCWTTMREYIYDRVIMLHRNIDSNYVSYIVDFIMYGTIPEHWDESFQDVVAPHTSYKHILNPSISGPIFKKICTFCLKLSPEPIRVIHGEVIDIHDGRLDKVKPYINVPVGAVGKGKHTVGAKVYTCQACLYQIKRNIKFYGILPEGSYEICSRCEGKYTITSEEANKRGEKFRNGERKPYICTTCFNQVHGLYTDPKYNIYGREEHYHCSCGRPVLIDLMNITHRAALENLYCLSCSTINTGVSFTFEGDRNETVSIHVTGELFGDVIKYTFLTMVKNGQDDRTEVFEVSNEKYDLEFDAFWAGVISYFT